MDMSKLLYDYRKTLSEMSREEAIKHLVRYGRDIYNKYERQCHINIKKGFPKSPIKKQSDDACPNCNCDDRVSIDDREICPNCSCNFGYGIDETLPVYDALYNVNTYSIIGHFNSYLNDMEMTEYEVDLFNAEFKQICMIYQYIPIRHNRFSKYYVIYKIAQKHGMSHIMKKCKLAGDRALVIRDDELWRKVCNELEWKFMPTPL